MEFNLYLVRNLIDGSMYVGQTIRLVEKRWKQHLYQARKGVETHLHRAIRKYGAENFVVDPIVPIGDDFTDCCGLTRGCTTRPQAVREQLIHRRRLDTRMAVLTGVKSYPPKPDAR
jgi:hypothetical protein